VSTIREVTDDGSVVHGIEIEIPAQSQFSPPKQVFFWAYAQPNAISAYEKAAFASSSLFAIYIWVICLFLLLCRAHESKIKFLFLLLSFRWFCAIGSAAAPYFRLPVLLRFSLLALRPGRLEIPSPVLLRPRRCLPRSRRRRSTSKAEAVCA
jgi:hypothetical protein